jgi:hypothetical protein
MTRCRGCVVLSRSSNTISVLTQVLYDNMSVTRVCQGDDPLPPIVNAPNGPFAAGTQPRYRGLLVDSNGRGIALGVLATFTLTIADTVSGEIINGVDRVDILNTGRGLVDDGGGFVITLETADTMMDEVPGAARIARSLVIEWTTTDTPPETGRHQADFVLLRLATE